MFVRGGRCTPRIRPGGGEESDGDGGGRDRGSGGDPGMVATAASGMQPAAAFPAYCVFGWVFEHTNSGFQWNAARGAARA